MGRVMPLWFYDGQVGGCAPQQSTLRGMRVFVAGGKGGGACACASVGGLPYSPSEQPARLPCLQTMLLAIGTCTFNWLFTAFTR